MSLASKRPPRAWHHWTHRESSVVRLGWGHVPISHIAKQIDRTPRSVYRHAVEALGLDAGCPQGFEYVSHAARRTGFSRGTMNRILAWAHVKVRAAASMPGSKGHERIVEPSSVDGAVARWCATETLVQAGVRLGYSAFTIGRVLKSAASRDEIALPPHERGKQWRIERSLTDLAFGRHMAREGVIHAARRISVAPETMRRWLVEAGVPRPASGRWWLDPAVVTRIADAKRAADSKAFKPNPQKGVPRHGT